MCILGIIMVGVIVAAFALLSKRERIQLLIVLVVIGIFCTIAAGVLKNKLGVIQRDMFLKESPNGSYELYVFEDEPWRSV